MDFAHACPVRRRRSGFTLIELLVVISIIALLVSILLPALTSARATGRQAKCLSNQRQIAIAMRSYAVDNKQYFPRAAGPPYSGSQPTWQNAGIYWTGLLVKGTYMPKDTSFICPDFAASDYSDDVKIVSAPDGDWDHPYWRNIDYSANRYLISGVTNPTVSTFGQSPSKWDRSARVDDVQDETNTLTTMDGWYPLADPRHPAHNPNVKQRAFFMLWGFPTTQWESPHARHAGENAINLGYVDGHVTSFRVRDMFDVWADLPAYTEPDNPWDLESGNAQ